MGRTFGVMLLVVMCACAAPQPVEDDAGEDAGAQADAALEAGPDATVDAAPDAPSCTCSGVSTCCDGCMPRNMGMSCVDALVCTGSRCSAAGTCVSTGVPTVCTPPGDSECQIPTCSEPTGCAFTNYREGMSCSDDNAGTFDDHCASGACVGTPCECSSGPCCDGCHFRPNTYACIDDGRVSAECSSTSTYGGLCPGLSRITYRIGDRFCTGSSSACTGSIVNGPSFQDVPCETMTNWDHPTVCRTDPNDPLGARCAMWCE